MFEHDEAWQSERQEQQPYASTASIDSLLFRGNANPPSGQNWYAQMLDEKKVAYNQKRHTANAEKKVAALIVVSLNEYLEHTILCHWMCNFPFEQDNEHTHTHRLFVHRLCKPLAHRPCHDVSVLFSLVCQVYYIRCDLSECWPSI